MSGVRRCWLTSGSIVGDATDRPLWFQTWVKKSRMRDTDGLFAVRGTLPTRLGREAEPRVLQHPFSRRDYGASRVSMAVVASCSSRHEDHTSGVGRSLSPRNTHTQEMKPEPRSRQRVIFVGLGLIGVVLALTWVVLYLNAGATSSR